MELMEGDCLELMKEIPDSSVDMVFADLPYGTTSNKWDIVIPFDRLWEQYFRVGKPCAAFVFTASQPFSSMLVASCMGLFRHEWIWIKNAGSNFANTVREPFKEHESILVFSRGKWTYNKQMQERAESGKSRVKTPVKFETGSDNYRQFDRIDIKQCPELRVPSSWQKFNRERGLHPNQKPVALCEYFIKTYSNSGETVLDNTMGSGSTGEACLNLGRRFIGIEKDHKYFEVARKRLESQVKFDPRDEQLELPVP